MPSSTARTIATSSAIDSRPRVGVAVANPSFWSPATTMSQPGAEAQAPWTRTIVGLSESSARAVAGRTETISTAAINIISQSNRGLVDPRTSLRACRASEAFIESPRRARLDRVYKSETDRVYIDDGSRFRIPIDDLRVRVGTLPAGCQLTLGSATLRSTRARWPQTNRRLPAPPRPPECGFHD